MRQSLALVLLSFATAGAISLYEPPKVVPRVDYSLGVVFLELWRGDRYIGIEKVIALEDYLDYQLKESIVENWKEESKREREREELASDAKGLIPDIEIPKLPVFGEGSKIDISGQDQITLGGRQTAVEGVTQTTTGQRWLPELKMEQQLAVKLDGTIGERTKVSIDHDSEREEGKNKIRLSYTGTDDDIVQSVELGDTRLSIPGTGYTGDLPAHKGLFGVSAQGKLAGVDVYAIASREESQGQTQEFRGRLQVNVDTIYDREFVVRRFYYVEAPGRILNLRLYVDDRNPGNNQATIKAIATVFPDFPDSVPPNDWERATGDFDLKTMGTDFVLHPGNILELALTLGQQDVVGAVVFTDQDTVGGQSVRDSLVLNLLKPDRSDSLSLTWDHAMRNVYALPEAEVQLNSARLFRDNPQGEDIEYETDGAGAGRKFTELLGLDPDGDGKLEYPQFDSKTGFIRFPDPKPFASSALSVRDSVIYRKDPLDPNEGRKYYLVVEYSSATESYYLGQPDIEKNSEKVYVNNVPWTSGTEYEINYETGMLSFLKPLPAEADVRVTFEYRPWFSLAQKSLLGARAEWSVAQKGKVGTSVFYRSEGVPEDKPVLGSEPFRRMIAEADASYDVSSAEVSSFLDRLPLVRAQAPSTFAASAEAAVSLPDPNTKGMAYLDDFEATAVTRDAGTNAVLWYHASVPLGQDTADFAPVPLFWTTDQILRDSVFGEEVAEEGIGTEDFLRTVFTPADTASWAGMMTSPYQMGMNLKDVENLQVILRSRRGRGRIHFSLGTSIDEDAPRRSRSGSVVGLNGRLDTEDKNGNGVLEEIEDSGLDTVFGTDEEWTEGSADDGNDDFEVTKNPSGTEGNRRMDSEDLDRSGFSRYNHYFEGEIALGDERFLSSRLRNGWELYRVSLHDTSLFAPVGSPKWEDVRLVRVWFDGFEAQDTIDFFSIEFVGSRWLNPTISQIADTNFVPVDTTEKIWVAQISKTTDTGYVPPFEPKKDPFGREEQEASLLFGYTNLYSNRRGTVTKNSAERDDYRDYRELRLYAHDDGNGLVFLVRLGSDSANYYEYWSPVDSGKLVPGRDGKWYEFTIPLDSLPRLKAMRDSLGLGRDTAVTTFGNYRLRGNPSLSDIRHTLLGIENHGPRPVSGAIWFDDMRLAEPRGEPGYGFQARANIGLSDLLSVGLTFSYSDPNFRKFSEGRGVKTGGFGTNLGTNLRANLDRLLPYSWGLSMPLTYAVARQHELPKFSARHPDLRLARDQGEEEAVVAQSEDISLDNVNKRKSGSKVLNYTVEAMAASWRQRRAYRNTTLTRDSSSGQALQWSYGLSPDAKIELGEDNDLYLLPQSVRFGVGSATRTDLRGTRASPTDTMRFDTTRTRGLNSDLTVDYSPIEDLSFDYGVTSDRDLLVANPDTLWFLLIGSEASHDENFGVSVSPDIGDFLTPSIEYDGDYSDDRPKADSVYADYRNMVNSGELDLGLGVDLPELLGRLEPEEKPSRGPLRGGLRGEPQRGEPPRGKSTGDEVRETGIGPGPDSIQATGDSTQAAEEPAGKPPAAGRPAASPPRAAPLDALRRGGAALSKFVDAVDLSYTVSRSSDIIRVFDPAPWHYRFGFSDSFAFDPLNRPASATRELRNSFRASSGAQVRELRARFAYDWSQGRNFNALTTVIDRDVSWPDLELSLGKVHNLFRNWATESKLSSKYRQVRQLGGQLTGDTLGMYGRTEARNTEHAPLLSWTTTWKKRVMTTLSTDYTYGTAVSYLSETGEEKSVTDSRSRSSNIDLSYSFSAPKGLKVPFLKRLRFSSDLKFSWSLRLSQTNRNLTQWAKGFPQDPVPHQRDNSWSTRVAASYSFTRSVEAGLNSSYAYTKGLSGTTTKTTDVNVWVLFRF